MSLKSFHLFFIGVSILLALGFGVWEVNAYRAQPDAAFLALGLLSFAVAAALGYYEVRLVQRWRGMR